MKVYEIESWLENNGFYNWQGKTIYKKYQANIYCDIIRSKKEIEIYTYPKQLELFVCEFKKLTPDILREQVNKLLS